MDFAEIQSNHKYYRLHVYQTALGVEEVKHI